MVVRDGGALDVVHAYLGELESGGRASPALLRQRSWALREAVLFAATRAALDAADAEPLTPEQREAALARTPRVRVGDLFAVDFVEDWLGRADAVLRGTSEPNVSTQRARMASLRALAAFSGAEIPAHRHPKPVLRTVLTAPEISSALQALTTRLPGRGPDDHVRLAAVLAVMSVWPVRSVELSAMRAVQVRNRGSEVVLDVVTPDGPSTDRAGTDRAGTGAPAESSTSAEPAEPPVLQGVSAERMRQWLAVRESLLSALLGGPVHTLWVSIRSNSKPGGPRGSLPLPPGMPLKPRGLQRAYARSVEAANLVHAGLPGFPLPRSLDLLRRSIVDSQP